MERIIKKILIYFFTQVRTLILKTKYWEYTYDKNITLANNIKLKSSTLIESRFGGSIVIEKGTELLENVLVITYGGNIKIGERCSINSGTIIYGHGGVNIGNDVLIAGGCMIIPNSHNFNDINKPIALQGNTSKGIIIEDDVWIGHGCSILDGVTIKKGAIIGAGSVVRKDVESYSIVAGIPAKIVGKRGRSDI